ncbi:hypothetical protein HMPREF0519_0276, partial [Lentilactobacillus hilgardii DSM 20176 = ATCC 8290]
AFLVIPALVAVDLTVKEWAHANLAFGDYFRVWTGFGLTHVFNPGMSFSLFRTPRPPCWW